MTALLFRFIDFFVKLKYFSILLFSSRQYNPTGYLKDLYQNGYIQLPSINPTLIDQFVNSADSNYPLNFDCYGIAKSNISFEDIPFIDELFTPQLYEILSKFLPSRFCFRNSPVWRVDNEQHRTSDHPQHLYHLDGALLQISIIVLLEDLTINSYHTSFIPSPLRFHFFIF